MMILTVPEIRAAEEFTMQSEQISSLELMERAGSVFAAAILPYCKNISSVYIFCGPGNNGGDGLQWSMEVCASRMIINHFPQENTIIINCQLSIVNCAPAR